MGTVRRQSIISTLFIYLGFGLGAFNTLVLVPRFADPSYLGLWNLLIQLSLTMGLLFTLGSIPPSLKFWPLYRKRLTRDENDLPALTLIITCVGALIFLCAMPFLSPLLARKYGAKSPLFLEYQWLLYPFTLTLIFYYYFEGWSWNLKQTVLPNFLREVAVRFLFFCTLLALGFQLISLETATIIYGFSYLIPVCVIGVIYFRNREIRLSGLPSVLTKRLWKRLAMFGLFLFTGQVCSLLAKTVDSIIISSQSQNGIADNGLFTVATFVTTVIEAPQRGMLAIAMTTLLEAWRNKDHGRISRMYSQTSILMLIFGLGIFLMILINLPALLQFMGGRFLENAALITSLVLVLGLAKLIDLGTGLNSLVLMSSKFWRADFIFNLLFVVAAIPLNYYLIRNFGVMGSAYANLASVVIFNTFRSAFIYRKFRLHPFGFDHLKVLVLATLLFFCVQFLPLIVNPLFTSVVKSVLVGGIYGTVVYFMKISHEFNDTVRLLLKKVGF